MGVVAMALMTAACQEDNLYELPKPENAWTSSCEAANNDFVPKTPDDPNTDANESLEGRVVTDWGSEFIRHAVHRIVQADAGLDTEGSSDDEDVPSGELQQRECLVSQAFYEAGQQRCAEEGTAAAISGMVLSGPNDLRVVMDVARDEFGNQQGYFPGGACRPDVGFDETRFELPLIATTSWGNEVGLTLSFMPGGVPAANIDTQETPSLPDDGIYLWAGQYAAATDGDGNSQIFRDEYGNVLTHAPWMEAESEMVNAEGEIIADDPKGWCLTPDTHTNALAAYLNNEGCVVPPVEKEDEETE